MKKSYRDDNGEKVFRYSIRKYHFGAASVAVAALMFFANGAVAASETITPTTASDVVTAGSDGNADGDPGTSDEEDSSKVSTRQPLELKSVDELKGQEAPVEENNQVQAAAESETTGVESNSAQPETNPASQEAPQAEGEEKQDQSTSVSNQTSSTSLLQPRVLKSKQSDYDPIPLGDDEDDEDDVRDGLFSSENPVTTIQPRSPRSVTSRAVPPKTTGSSPYNDKYRYYFERGQDPENSQLPRYTYAFFNERVTFGLREAVKVSHIKNYLEEEVTPTVDGLDWKVTVNKGRQNLDGISFLFSVPNGQSLVPNSVTVTQVDDAGTTVKSSDPRDRNDDHITASLKATNAKEVRKGTPTRTNASGGDGFIGSTGHYDVSSIDGIWNEANVPDGDSFHSRGQGNNNNARTGLQNDEERNLGDSKKKIINSSGGTVYSGKIAGNTSYTITFKTTGNNDLDKSAYFSAVKGSGGGKTYLAMLLHARTQGERDFADKTRFRLKGNGYYQVEQNTAYYTSTVLNSTGQEIKKDGANTAYSYSKYKDKPLDNGVKGVLTGNDTNDTDKAFDLDEYSYSEYVDDQGQVLNKDDLLAELQDEQQTITWYKGDQQISKSDLTKDAISSSGVHTYRYRVSYKDNSFNEGKIHFVTKPKKPIIDTDLSTVAETSTNVRVSNVDSNTTVELYKKGNNGQNDTLVSSISSGNQGGTVTFNNVNLDYGSYYVKQKANGTWYEQDGTKREGVYSDQSSEKEASRIVIERIGAIGGQSDTRWKDKQALSDVTDFNLPTGSEVLIGFRAKSPKGIKSLTISGADNLKGKTVETYGRNSNDDQTTLGINLRSRGGNSGGYSITVTATDGLGNEKHYKMNIIFPPNSGSFEKNPTEDHVTPPEKLKGKALVPLATENPNIVIKAKGINVDTVNGIDNKHEWRAFLVDGGRNIQDSASGSQKAVDFKSHIVAETSIKEGGTAEFISASQTGHFKREHLGRKPLRLVVAMVNKKTREIVDKYVSALSSDTLEATYPQFTKSPDFIKEPREITAKIGHLQADKAQIRYTNDAGTDKTVNFSKVNGNWEKDNPNQDSTIVVTEDTGTAGTATVHIPSGTAKGGTKIYARQKVDANTEYSEESSIDVPTGPTVQHPNKPEINQSQEDLDVTIKVGQGNANRATVVFIDSRGSFQSVMFSKTGNSWDKVQAQAAPDVSVTSTNDGTALVRIPYGVAKIGSQVVTNQREEGQTIASENASHIVQGDTTAPKVSLGDILLPTTANAATTPIYKVVQGSAFTPKLKIWDNSGSIKNLDITGIPNGVTKQKFGNDFAEQTTAKQATPYSGSTLTGAAADTQSLGVHTAQITVKDASNNVATYYLKYEVYPARVEAKQGRFGQVKDKALIHGDKPADYIKFKNANNQEVQKPADVEVTWERKPSTVEAGINKTGVVKVTYHVTDENGMVRDEVQTVTINTPVYHATLVQNPFKTTYGGEFVNKAQPRDGRRYINYNGRPHFNLSNLRVYWENSNIRGEKFSDGTRPWSTNYLGKRLEQLEVRYPGDNGRYDNSNDDSGERYERLNGTFIVKPVKPSIQTSLGKVGKNTLTVNNVNSGTTVVVYDAANPNNLKELGRTMVAKEGDYRIKNGVEVPLNSGVTFKKDQKIVTKVIYEITDRDQRTDSDVSDTWTVKESLIANGIHVIKGESYTGTAKDRIRYNDNVDADHRTALPNNATASWAQNPNYTTLGTNNYTANVTIPGQGSATVDVPVHVYAPASLKANSYNNKQGTLSNGDNPENYIEFKDGNTVVTKPNNVTVRWQGGVVPRINTPGHNRGVIEVVYPGNAGASSTVVKTFTVQLPTYHTTATATEYTRTISDNFAKTNARDYATTHNWNVGGSQYVWKNDETANREYSAENWGKVNGDWLGKKTNKVKVYYGNDNGSNSHSENLAEETEEITFVTKPKTPSITATALNGKAGQRNQQVTVNNVTPGTTVKLYNGDTEIGSVDVPKADSEAYTDTKTVTVTVNGQLPLSSNIRAKTIYRPNDEDEKVESDFSDSVQSTTEGPQAPEISQNPEDLVVKSTVGQGGSTKVTLTYTDANGRVKEVGFTKNGQFWDKDNANADTTVSITNESNGIGEIQLQPGTAQEGSTVTVKQKTATSEFSTPATTKALGRLNGLTNVAQADGSVDITVPDTATKFDLTYRNQQNNTTETLHYSKDTQGNWENVTGITANGNRFTLPKGLVTDGTTVYVIASNDNKTTKTVTSDAKFEMPDATTHTQRENGDGVITLPSTADSVTVTYTDNQNNAKTVTLTKDASNQWASTAALPEGVTLTGDELSVAYKNINDGNVKTVSTRGTGNVRSQEAVENIELSHRPVSTQAVVIAAGATPTNDDLGRGVTFAKRSITAKSTPAAVPAGTSAEIPATLTYNDGSTEDVTITVKSKPTAPSFDNLENHGTYSGLSSISKVISGTAMPGAEKVKLTLQDGTVKEITPQADGSWSYTLGATEYLTQSFSGQFNGVFNQNKVKAVQVKDGVESEETTANVAPGQATVDSVYKAGRAITVNIPHDIEAGYVRVNGTDYGIQKVNGTWRVISTAPNAAKLEISNTVVDPTNKAVTKVTFSVKNNDDALYTPPFKIGNSSVRFRTHYSKNGTINTPTPQILGTDGWADSPTPKNTKPTVNFTADHTIEENKVFASPTVEELKDYFEGHDAEDDASLTVGYSASNRGKLRVQVFTQDTNQSVRANAQGRIDPGNYRLVLSTNDAADAESEPITRNIIVKTYADVYRDKVLYPANDDKVIYDDTAISNGNFTTAAKTSFKEKIQEANRQNTQLPTSVTYSVGNTDDKTKVAVINFPDGSTIDISHAVVAKPTVPTITRTHADKVSDADRTISGTALQSATKVTIYFQDGRGEQGHADVVPVNGQWTYTLPTGRYLRQTEHTSLPGSSSVPVNVTQTVFDATSDKTAVYVAKDRNFTGKQIVGTKGSQELTALKNDAKKGINYTERNTPKDFPSDFDATWKETPDITTVGTRTYTAKVFEKDKGDAVSQEISVEVTVKADTPSKVTAVQKDNGDVSLSLPSDGESVSISYRAEGVDKTLKLSKAGGNWSVTEGDRTVLAGDQVVLSYKGLDRTQVISTSATAGSDKYLSEAASDTYTVKEHSVTIAPIIRSNSDTLLSTAVEDAVTVSNKESVEKQGNLPTGIGKHTITAKVTYKDRSEEMVEIPYTIKPDAPSISTSIGTAGTNSVTINNVTPGTTVVVYDMTNPNNPLELGRKDVSGATADAAQNGVTVSTNAALRKDTPIAAEVIYKPTVASERIRSDKSSSLIVKEGLTVNSIHAVKGENYTGELASRVHYNDGNDTNLPAGSTVEWKNNQAPDYNQVGTNRYTLVVNVPEQGTTEVEVPVHVYPTASLKKASYTNKQGTLSNGTDASKYVQFEGSADTPNNVTVRWKDGVPDVSTVSADRKATIEIVYPGNASATDTVVKELEVSLPTYHSTAKATEYTRTIGEAYASTDASDYVETTPNTPRGTEYAWKTDETGNQAYGSSTWGGANGDWLGKKTNKVKVYYPNADGGNEKSEVLAEETEEITFITKPAKPSITSDLTWASGTRTTVEVGNVTSGTRVVLYDEQGNELGHTDVAKGANYSTPTTASITPTKDIPAGKVYVKTIYMPDTADQRVESEKSDEATAKTNTLTAKGIIQTLAGTGNIGGVGTLDAATLGKLLRQENGGTDFTGATAEWKDKTNLEKGAAGSRVEHLLVKLAGQSEKQDVAITVTTLEQPSAKAVLKSKGADLASDNLSDYVNAPGQGTLSWEGSPAKVEVGQTLPRIKVTYPTAGVAISDITDQYVDAKVYSLEANPGATSKVTVGDAFDPNASDYVQTVANTAALPGTGVSHAWKDGNKPTSATVGKATYTVVTSFGNDADVPAELRGQSVETQVEVTVLSTKPSKPEVSQNRTDLSITAVVGKDDATKAKITFRDELDQEHTVSFTKGANGQWDKDDANSQPTVQIINNADGTATVHMTGGTAKAGSTVVTKQQKADSDFSDVSELVAKEHLDGATATTKDDGSVEVVVPKEADTATFSYVPEGQTQEKTVTISKGQDGTWTAPADSDLVIKKDDATGRVTVTVPADKVADGSTVKGKVDSATKLSPEVEAKAKAPQPSEFSVRVLDNGDEVITLPQNADSVTINYPVSDANVKTVTISKGQDGTWSGPADSDLVIKKDDATGAVTVTVPADKISGNRTITASAKAGTGAGESTQRDFTQTVPEHQAPTISEVTVAAGATPDAAALNAAITAPKKVKAEATEALKAVAAGTSVTIPVTITYQDGSTEPAEVTVYSKQSTPSKVTAVQKDNGDVSLSLPSDGESVSISYRAEGVDKTLKLSKAGGNWSVTEGDRTVLAGDQVVLSYKGLDRTQVISTSATAGSDKYLSEAASDTYTVKEHSVTIAPLTKPFEQNVTDKDLLDAVNADHKKSAKLKDGTSYPTTDGFHDIELTVTYEDGSMENVSVKYKVTDTSKNNINQIAKAKKDAIDGDNQLTNEEKKAAKDKVDAAADKAKQAVDAATTNDGVTQAQNNATTNSNSVDTTPHSKSNAKAEIDTKVEEANNAIDQNKDMTDDERREAKKAVKDAADKAKEAIDNATTDADVTRAKNNGKQAINDINPQPAPRPNPVLTPRPDNGGNTGTSVTPSARSRRSVAFAGGTPSSQEKTVDKSELHKLVEELETRLKDLDGIDQSVIDAAKNILGEGQEALRNTDLTEAGLKEITAKVKEALESLKGKQATKDEEETKEIRKEQGHLPYGTMIGSLLALLGLLLFLIARRKKESELKKLTKELTKVLQESDLTSVDAKVLDQVREALAQAVAFLANEKESDHTEDELIEKLKAILAQLR
ncbi:surface anchored protein [Streptococcus pneumoniae]|uniref:DUF1542 domain-containing protein n=13 Tax=Streptococcus pneumoniae TaxID=1313 RepID=UPI0005E04710|nr:DUF1542 domain-containing protein [Streptococcus pneumoniae]CJA40014.1 surface anchored protein [Streptococcus pneumoniae]